MTNTKNEFLWLNVKNDLKAFNSNKKYLGYKFDKLSDSKKKEIMYMINLYLYNDIVEENEPKTPPKRTLKETFADALKEKIITDSDMNEIYWKLPTDKTGKIFYKVVQLFRFEPCYKGRRLKFSSMYKKLSLSSKHIVSNYLRSLINEESAPSTNIESKSNKFESAIIIDFQSRKPVREEASL